MQQGFESSPASKASHPKEFFLHLLAIFTLYVSVVSFIILLFQYINVLFPDPLSFYLQGALDSIRWSSASLIVMFPMYLFCSWILQKDIAIDSEKAEYRVRKWLLHFTLFVAAITIIIDIITLLYNFLSGELTIRFFFKVLVVLLTAGTVFGYYLADIRQKDFGRSTYGKMAAYIVSAIVILSIIAGFFIVGTPAEQRRIRFDERRVNDLQMIQNEVINYWTQKNRLPEALDDLKNSISGFIPPVDPKTSAEYGYSVKSKFVFELCAAFETSAQNLTSVQSPRPIYDSPYGQNWDHESGQTCFERTIDPDLYRKEGVPLPVKY